MDNITINGQQYKIGKLDPFKQLHVARRLAPALLVLGGALKEASTTAANPAQRGVASENSAAEGEAGTAVVTPPAFVDALVDSIGPLSQVLAGMSDADTDYVVQTCLRVCSRLQNNQYAPLILGNGKLMFEDIGLPVMMQLTFAVIQENLGNFFDALP